MDFLIFQFINNFALKNFWLDTFFIFLAKYLGFVLIGVLFVFLLKNFKKYRQMVLQAFLAGGIAEIITEIAALFWFRPRPFVVEKVNLLLTHSPTASFPSSHAAFFFALSIILYLYNKKAGLLFLIAGFLIGIGRVFVGIHWPADILAGAALGVLSALLINKLWKRFHSGAGGGT